MSVWRLWAGIICQNWEEEEEEENKDEEEEASARCPAAEAPGSKAAAAFSRVSVSIKMISMCLDASSSTNHRGGTQSPHHSVTLEYTNVVLCCIF